LKKHFENSSKQKKYQESEKLLNEIPIQLRDKIIAKTHSEVFRKIKFFQARSRDFNSLIVKELKPLTLGKTELLYSQGDAATQIYFIHTGKVMLYVDVIQYIKDDSMLRMIQIIQR